MGSGTIATSIRDPVVSNFMGKITEGRGGGVEQTIRGLWTQLQNQKNFSHLIYFGQKQEVRFSFRFCSKREDLRPIFCFKKFKFGAKS